MDPRDFYNTNQHPPKASTSSSSSPSTTTTSSTTFSVNGEDDLFDFHDNTNPPVLSSSSSSSLSRRPDCSYSSSYQTSCVNGKCDSFKKQFRQCPKTGPEELVTNEKGEATWKPASSSSPFSFTSSSFPSSMHGMNDEDVDLLRRPFAHFDSFFKEFDRMFQMNFPMPPHHSHPHNHPFPPPHHQQQPKSRRPPPPPLADDDDDAADVGQFDGWTPVNHPTDSSSSSPLPSRAPSSSSTSSSSAASSTTSWSSPLPTVWNSIKKWWS